MLTSFFLQSLPNFSLVSTIRQSVQPHTFFYGYVPNASSWLESFLQLSCDESTEYSEEQFQKSIWVLCPPKETTSTSERMVYLMLAMYKMVRMQMNPEQLQKLILVDPGNDFWDSICQCLVDSYHCDSEWMNQHVYIISLEETLSEALFSFE